MRIIESDSQAKHLQEWLGSGVDEEIFHLNVKSLFGTLPYEYLLYSPKISRRNDGRLRDRDLKKYQHIELGGWWCSGIDPLNNYVSMMWGCFKPDHPRRDRQKIHKFIKYEHPFREETRAFFLLVPNRIWVKVSNRSGIPITEEDLQHPGGFWHWIWRHNVPVTIVEGVKKAGALLTAGYAAIAIPGVNAGYRTPTDEYGTAIGKPYLIPDLKHFATQGRQVNICFDQDNKPETVQRVNKKGVGGRVLGVVRRRWTELGTPPNAIVVKRRGLCPDGCWGCFFPHTLHPTPYTRPNGAGQNSYQSHGTAAGK